MWLYLFGQPDESLRALRLGELVQRLQAALDARLHDAGRVQGGGPDPLVALSKKVLPYQFRLTRNRIAISSTEYVSWTRTGVLTKTPDAFLSEIMSSAPSEGGGTRQRAQERRQHACRLPRARSTASISKRMAFALSLTQGIEPLRAIDSTLLGVIPRCRDASSASTRSDSDRLDPPNRRRPLMSSSDTSIGFLSSPLSALNAVRAPISPMKSFRPCSNRSRKGSKRERRARPAKSPHVIR